MATARQTQLQLQQERSASSRYPGLRNRTLSGYGGSLAGYGVSLEKTNADKEDQLMQKKFNNGEVSLDDYIAYLNKTQSRSWLTTEDKKMLLQNIRELTDNKNDEIMMAKYQSKQITARDYANYKRGVLQRLDPNSPKYSTMASEIATLDRNANIEDLNKKYNQEMSQISGIASELERDKRTAQLYSSLASEARAKGLNDEAVSYEQNANQYSVKAKAQEIEDAKTLKTTNKQSLVDKINLAINDYIDNKLNPQQFNAQLDLFEREAIKNGNTDLLNDLNSWVNNVREDIKFGKSWERGGTRRGKTGSGEGGDGITIGTGTGSTLNKPLPKDFIGPPEAKKYADNIDGQTEKYVDNVKKLQSDYADGNISTEQYFSTLNTLIDSRNQDIENFKSQLVGKKSTAKINTGNSKSTVASLLKEFETEQTSNWGLPLGMTASEVGGAGTSDLSKAMGVEKKSGYKNLVQEVSTSTELGGDVTKKITKKGIIENLDVVDTPVGRYKVTTEKVPELNSFEYMNLSDQEKENYKLNMGTGKYENITKGTTRFVDIPDSKGNTIRYVVDEKNNIKDVIDQSGNSMGKITDTFLPKNKLDELVKIQTEQANKPKPILEGVQPDNISIPKQVVKKENIPTSVVNPITKTQEPVTQIAPGTKLSQSGDVSNIIKPVSPVTQPEQTLKINVPQVSPIKTSPIIQSGLSDIGPSDIIKKPTQTLQKPLIPTVYQPTLSVSDSTKKLTDQLNKTIEKKNQPNLLQKATSWITGLFKK